MITESEFEVSRSHLAGQVTDQNGTVVVRARITVRSASGTAKTTTTDNGGSYRSDVA